MVAFKPRYETLVDIFQGSVRRHADRPLFGIKRRGAYAYLTYGEFEKSVDALRTALASLGVAAGDRVAIVANNRPEWAIAAYATYGLGAIFVAMYESQSEGDWEYVLADSGAKVLFVPGQVIARRIEAHRVCLPMLRNLVVLEGPTEKGMLAYDRLLEDGRRRATPTTSPASSDVASIVYTSGTTARPKGVMLTHGNFAHNVSAIREVFPVDATDRSLSFLPWAHAFGQTVELHAMFSMGASMALSNGPERVLDELAEVAPTLLFGVPNVFNRLYDRIHAEARASNPIERKLFEAALANAKSRRELAAKRMTSGFADLQHRVFDELVFKRLREKLGGRLRFAISGAAALSREVADFVDDLGIVVFEGYGLTETAPIVAANCPGAKKVGTVGRPIPGVRVEIDNATTGDPKSGEIIVFGHNVMKGYHGLPDEDARAFVTRKDERGFRTGDMGFVDGEGFLHITGRIKEQYKLANGRYVVPTPLEDALRASPYVRTAMVFGENAERNSAIIVPEFDVLIPWARKNGITGDPPSLVENERIRALLESEVARCSSGFRPYEKIERLILGTSEFTTESGMLTPTLKVRRARVLEVYADEIARTRS